MLNLVAVQVMNYLLAGPLHDKTAESVGGLIPQTQLLPESSWLPILKDGTQLHLGVVVAVLAAVAVYVLLWRTSFGFRIRAVGLSRDAATYAGMPVARTTTYALTLSGALCGMAGAMLVFGSISHRMVTDGSLTGFTGSAGFNGIVVALFGGLNPLWTILSSFVFAGLLVGGDAMQVVTNVPSDLIVALNGLVVVFVVSVEFCAIARASRRRRQGPAEPRGARRRVATVEPTRASSSPAILTATVASGSSSLRPSCSPRSARRSVSGAACSTSGSTGSCCSGVHVLLRRARDRQLAARRALWGGRRRRVRARDGVHQRDAARGAGISGIGVYLFALGLTSLLFLKLVRTPLRSTSRERSRFHSSKSCHSSARRSSSRICSSTSRSRSSRSSPSCSTGRRSG
jgi:ABC-type uncharacterized transport system permease subunit